MQQTCVKKDYGEIVILVTTLGQSDSDNFCSSQHVPGNRIPCSTVKLSTGMSVNCCHYTYERGSSYITTIKDKQSETSLNLTVVLYRLLFIHI
jgi:hypothetical protein